MSNAKRPWWFWLILVLSPLAVPLAVVFAFGYGLLWCPACLAIAFYCDIAGREWPDWLMKS